MNHFRLYHLMEAKYRVVVIDEFLPILIDQGYLRKHLELLVQNLLRVVSLHPQNMCNSSVGPELCVINTVSVSIALSSPSDSWYTK